MAVVALTMGGRYSILPVAQRRASFWLRGPAAVRMPYWGISCGNSCQFVAVELEGEVEEVVVFGLEVAGKALAGAEDEVHGVALGGAGEGEKGVVGGGGEGGGEVGDGAGLNVGGVPGGGGAGRVAVAGGDEFVEDDGRVLFEVADGGDGGDGIGAAADGVVAEHVGIEVVVSAVVEDFGDGVAGEEPDAGVFEAAGLPDGFEERGDLVAETEAVAVEELDGIEDLAEGLLIGPAGDVIPEAWGDEAAVGEEEAPDGLGAFAGGAGAGCL